MKRKTTLLGLTALFTIAISFDAITNGSGAPGGRSGSPASIGSCASAGCHTGPAITTETVSITSDIPATGFLENTDYNITITADAGGRNISRMGFQASVESAAGAEGSLSAPASDVQLVAGNFVTHTFSGTSASGGNRSWTFVWNSGSAPDQTRVYAAVNFANNNGSTNGDAILTQQLALSKDITVSIAEETLQPAGVYPNPAREHFSVQGIDRITGHLRIFDLQGKLMREFERADLMDRVSLDGIQPGVYVIADEGGYSEYLHVLR